MHDNTGTIGSMEQLRKMFPTEPLDSFRPIAALTKRQEVTHQTLAYEECPCGSGNKFKFCCHAAAQERKNIEQLRRSLLGAK